MVTARFFFFDAKLEGGCLDLPEKLHRFSPKKSNPFFLQENLEGKFPNLDQATQNSRTEKLEKSPCWTVEHVVPASETDLFCERKVDRIDNEFLWRV